MLKRIAFFCIFGAAFVNSLNWLSNSHVIDSEQYFINVMQETIEELERREWCNLKLDNVYQSISEILYNFLVEGTVVYSNGFLVSIQNIDVSNIQNLLTARTVDGVTTSTATVRGRLRFNDALVGFDVEATISNNGEATVQKSTGTFNYLLMEYEFQIQKNLNTEEVSATSALMSLSGGSGVRMIYHPANNITEALSRRWVAGNTWDSVGRWGSVQMVPIIVNITNTVLPFPDICIGCYA